MSIIKWVRNYHNEGIGPSGDISGFKNFIIPLKSRKLRVTRTGTLGFRYSIVRPIVLEVFRYRLSASQ